MVTVQPLTAFVIVVVIVRVRTTTPWNVIVCRSTSVQELGGSPGPGVGKGEAMQFVCRSTQGLVGSAMLTSLLPETTVQPPPVTSREAGQELAECWGTTVSDSTAPAKLAFEHGGVS